MSDQDAFERVLTSIYDAMLDDSRWPATSALIDEACGIHGNTIMIREGSQDDSRVLFVGLYYRGQRREDYERVYLETYHPINEGVPRFRQLPDSRVVHTPELYTAEELKTSPTYNEAFPLGNAQNGLQVRLDGPDGSHISWCPLDPVAPGGWGAAQLAMVKGLLPHIRQFVCIRQALVKAEALGTSVIDLLGNPRMGVIHLDRRGQIMEANDRARHILRYGDGLADQNRMLHARLPDDQVRLERLLAGALPTSSAPAVSGSMLLHRPDGLLPFVVHVKPTAVRQPDYGVRRVAALVLVVEPGHPSHIDAGLVATALGLTPAESQLAVGLTEGKTVSEIAVATGRSENTLYWHLKRIYHKLHISRQADLVRFVLSVTEFP